MKKPLQDFKKQKFIEPKDRVYVIACTSKPWETSSKECKAFFDKKYYFPYPNYGTRLNLFKNYVEKQGISIPPNFPISTLAKITEGYSSGSVCFYYIV